MFVLLVAEIKYVYMYVCRWKSGILSGTHFNATYLSRPSSVTQHLATFHKILFTKGGFIRYQMYQNRFHFRPGPRPRSPLGELQQCPASRLGMRGPLPHSPSTRRTLDSRYLSVGAPFPIPRNVRRILVRGQCPMPPETKKILKIWPRNGAVWSISE